MFLYGRKVLACLIGSAIALWIGRSTGLGAPVGGDIIVNAIWLGALTFVAYTAIFLGSLACGYYTLGIVGDVFAVMVANMVAFALRTGGVNDIILNASISTVSMLAVLLVATRFAWLDESAMPARKSRDFGFAPPNPGDNRTFEATFNKPVRVKLEHNGRVVLDQIMSGHLFIRVGDYAPYSGVTTLWIDGEQFGYWDVN